MAYYVYKYNVHTYLDSSCCVTPFLCLRMGGKDVTDQGMYILCWFTTTRHCETPRTCKARKERSIHLYVTYPDGVYTYPGKYLS